MNSSRRERNLIVAVDDNEDDRFFFSRLVLKAGLTCEIQPYDGGEEATAGLQEQLARHVVPLACFLDVKMPAMSGFDVLSWIRKQRTLDDMPVLMLTTSDDPADLRRAEKLGAQCYLRKHPSPRELHGIIQSVMNAGVLATEWLECPANMFARQKRKTFQEAEGDE